MEFRFPAGSVALQENVAVSCSNLGKQPTVVIEQCLRVQVS
jgi:hypothetical protein